MARDMPSDNVKVKEQQKAEELDGKLQFQAMDDKLMHSVMENDQQTIEQGKLLNEAMNNNISAFTPDLMMEQMVKNFKLAKQIYGQKLIRALSGFDDGYVEKNVRIPEFQRDLKKKISDNIEKMKNKKLLNKDSSITEKGIELASLVSYIEELDNLEAKGLEGEKFQKKEHIYGDKGEVRSYKKGDRYRDISVRKTIKTAIRRQSGEINTDDLRVHGRQAKGKIHIIYALDSSASMKGDKIDKCKKAGIALAYKAINEKDNVGLIVFGKDVEASVPPTRDFTRLLKNIVSVKAFQETNIAKTIKEAIELFPDENVSRHLILITDALPTAGKKPREEAIESAAQASSKKITISLVGINLDKEGEAFAKELIETGNGKLYISKDTDDIDKVILQDYYSMG
ncbi:MAG: vWA domain-containing protein [Nanoarchaeota archaeon]